MTTNTKFKMLIFAATTSVVVVIAPSYISNNEGWVTPSVLLISQFLFGFWLLYSSSIWRILTLTLLVIFTLLALGNLVILQTSDIESAQTFAAVTGVFALLTARKLGNKNAEQDSAGQPATRSESKSEDNINAQPGSKVRSQ